ncbi:MAG: arginine--tRNA ligase [Lentisphaeria bacterium]
MKFNIIKELEQHLAQVFNAQAPEISVERPPENFEGDITVNCFRLARDLRTNPMQIAEKAGEFCGGHSDVTNVEVVKAFVNVALNSAAVFRDAVADEKALMADTLLPAAERRRIVIEFSAPNTNKPQHLGHVRNNSLGQALVSILKKAGHDVIPVNLVNDRGIHICKSMLAYDRWGDGETPEVTGKKGDHFVGDYYVKFDQELKRQVNELRKAHPELIDKTDDELFLETEIGRATQEMLQAWENNDNKVRELWRTMNSWVLAGFNKTYERMGVYFDKTYLESETYGHGRELIEKHLDEGIFRRRDDGAVVIDLEKQNLGSKVVLRSDGTSVYVTQDIGTTVLKQETYNPDRQIWIVGDEQIYHFQVLFAILKRLGCEWAEELVHKPYGMVNLPSGRMKSREGTVVDADNLFDEMENLARTATLERVAEPPPDIDRRAKVIGMAALKFMLLKVNAKTTMMFDPEASVKFEGDTGPYLLYACARIASMQRKADNAALAGEVDWTTLGAPEEKDLALRCATYGETVRQAARDLDTSNLATYLLELAKSFSRFYRECPVLAAPDQKQVRARMELSRRVHRVLQDGLRTLTIETLETM